jgi:hypothetical protein
MTDTIGPPGSVRSAEGLLGLVRDS